ncbi:hypothetical protein BN1013_01618 [Candidatus Rubidus massiliensis]|nr:hypothetical protein BN1013_01618 [Candidatus Rubidus massiliensis]
MTKQIRTDPYELSYAARWETLTQEEEDYVVDKLCHFKDGDEELHLISWIFIIGQLNKKEYVDEIAKFLYYKNLPYPSGEAIKVLYKWGYIENYLYELEQFLIGVEWDDFDEIRLKAIEVAGEYLRHKFNKNILALLYEIYFSYGESELINLCMPKISFIKACAYQSLAYAMGQDWNTIPDNDDLESYFEENDTKTLSNAYLEKARQLLTEQE